MLRGSTINFTTTSITSAFSTPSPGKLITQDGSVLFPLYSIRYLEPKSLLASSPSLAQTSAQLKDDVPPPGTVKSILPCTPLGVVKALERVGVYNALLPYGDRAYGRTITVINRYVPHARPHHLVHPRTHTRTPRSEVVGRPLAALLANDGARVFSVDIDSIQEYTKRPTASAGTGESARRAFHPHHVVRHAPPELDLPRCLALSDVVVSAVPSATYKVQTARLKDGCVCVNVAADKNFGADVREKVRFARFWSPVLVCGFIGLCMFCRRRCIFPL